MHQLVVGRLIHSLAAPKRSSAGTRVMTIHGFFDRISGSSLYGWAWDDARPTEYVDVEAITLSGRIVGASTSNIFRGDLQDAGYGIKGVCAFKIDIPLSDLIGEHVVVRVKGEGGHLAGSPKEITLNPNLLRLLNRRAKASHLLPRLTQRLNRYAGKNAISIIMPVYNTPHAWLVEALESVRSQWCGKWELICIDDGSTDGLVRHILNMHAAADPRIRVLRSPQNLGIAHSMNYGLRAAKHDYVAFMDHDDYLEPNAVWRLIRAIQKTNADFLYSDEVLTGDCLTHFLDVRARPSFSYDYYLSHPYFVHLICVRKDLAHSLSGWNETMPVSADVDFVLRAIEKSKKIAHIPDILYRWRTHGDSAGHVKKDAVMSATTIALQRHLNMMRSGATARPGPSFNQFHVDWPIPDGKVLVVVPTKNGLSMLRKCVSTLQRTTSIERYKLVVIDHQSDDPATQRYLKKIADQHIVMPYKGAFNFSRMNNRAVKRFGQDCEFVLFLNNDIEAIEKGWVERLASLAARPDVGAVGPLLLFGDKRIQHAGVIIGYSNAAEHVAKFTPFLNAEGGRTLGANSILTSVRDYSAVTAACLMMRRKVFEEANGFDEKLPVAFQDTDLCLRVRELGYRNLYDGHTVLYHHESATRSHTNDLVHPKDTERFRELWGHLFKGADPYYSPFLSLEVEDHTLRNDLVSPAPLVRCSPAPYRPAGAVRKPALVRGKKPISVQRRSDCVEPTLDLI